MMLRISLDHLSPVPWLAITHLDATTGAACPELVLRPDIPQLERGRIVAGFCNRLWRAGLI